MGQLQRLTREQRIAEDPWVLEDDANKLDDELLARVNERRRRIAMGEDKEASE